MQIYACSCVLGPSPGHRSITCRAPQAQVSMHQHPPLHHYHNPGLHITKLVPGVQGGGTPLRGPVRSIYSVPTIVIFCEGLGIATARALIEAEPSVGSLNFPLRQSVRLYYRVSAGVRLQPGQAGHLLEGVSVLPGGRWGKGCDSACCPGQRPRTWPAGLLVATRSMFKLQGR